MSERKVLVLIIDDTPDYGEALVNALQERGFDAILKDAHSIPKSNDINYDYAFIHEHLKGQYDGIEVAKNLISVNKNIKTVFYTANPDDPDAQQKAYEAGVFRYVERKVIPSDFADFAQELANNFEKLEEITRELKENELLADIISKLGTGVVILDSFCYVIYSNQSARNLSRRFEERRRCPFFDPQKCTFRHTYTEVEEELHTGIKPLWETGRILDIKSNPIVHKEEEIGITLAITDVTEREKLLEFSQRKGRLKYLDDRLDYLLNEIKSLGYARGRVFILSPDKKFFVGRRYIGEHPNITQEGFRQFNFSIETDDFSKSMVDRQEARICFWDHKLKEEDERREIMLSKDPRMPWLSFPILYDNRLVGKLTVDFYNDPDRECAKQDIDRLKPFVDAIGPDVGQGLEIERLNEELDIETQLKDLEIAMFGKTAPRDALVEAIKWVVKKIGADGWHTRLYREDWLELINGQGPYYETITKANVRKYCHIDSIETKSSIALKTHTTQKGYRGESSFGTHDSFRQTLSEGPEKERLAEINSFAVYPLVFHGYKVGTLNFESKEKYFFERYDIERFIMSVQTLAAPLLMHMITEQQNARTASILETLTCIEQRVVGNTDINLSLWLVLTGMTVEFGLDFDRVIYFEYEGDGKIRKAKMAVQSEQPIKRSRGTIEEKIENLLKGFDNNRNERLNSAFQQRIKEISFDINIEGNTYLNEMLKNKWSILVAVRDETCQDSMIQRLRENKIEIPQNFAWAPVVSEGEVWGIVYADNVYSNKPIYKLDIERLMVFCNDIASSLSLARRSKLWESEYVRTTHNLLTPLHGIILGASALHDDKSLDEKQKRLAGIICSSAQEVSVQLRSILEMYNIRSGERPKKTIETVNLERMVRETLNLYAIIAERKRIKVTLRESEGISVQGVEHEFKHIINVLVSNAINYSEKDKEINVRVFKDKSKNHPNKDLAFVEVADQGWGIPEEDQGKIFDEGFRGGKALKNNKQGLGIGLSVVKDIVNYYYGNITFQSKKNIGTTFVVKLPLVGKEKANA